MNSLRRIRELARGPIARSTFKTTWVLVLRTITQAMLLLLLVRLLDPVSYGRLVSASALAIVLGLLPSFGAGFILMARTPGHADAAADVWRYAWPLTLTVGSLLLVLFLPVAQRLGGMDGLSMATLFWIGATELLLTPFIALLSHALQARERVPLSQVLQWLPLGLRLAAVAPCFLVSEPDRLSLFVKLQFLATLIGALGALTITMQQVALRWKPRIPTRSEFRLGASYASMQLVAANSSELDKVFSVRLVGAHSAGLYNVLARIMVALIMPVLAMLASAQPRVFRHAHSPGASARRLVKVVAMTALTWGILSGIALAACAPVLPIVLGKAYAEAAGLMPLMAMAAPFLALRFAAGMVLVAVGRPLERLAFELCGVLTLALSMFLLVPVWHLPGLIGALITAEAVMAFVGWWLVALRIKPLGTHRVAADRLT